MPIEKLYEAMATTLGASEAPSSTTEASQTTPADNEASSPAPTASSTTEPSASSPPDLPPAGERQRGVDGKFTKGGQPTAKAPPSAVPPSAAGPAPTVAPPAASPPPRTWGAGAREQWAALPRDVKDQILKREGDVARKLQEMEATTKGHQSMQEALAPFMPHLQALGVRPEAAVRELFQMEHTLRMGQPAQRAQLIAHLMERGGVGPAELAAVLEGRPASSQPAQQAQEFRDPRLDAFFGQMQQVSQRRASENVAKAQADLEAFQSTNPEFLEDVADEMADLIASSRRRGKPLTLQQAYDKACQLNDSVRTVLDGRKAEEAKRAQDKKVQQAQYAAGSVQSEPAPPSGGKKKGLNGMWDALGESLGR